MSSGAAGARRRQTADAQRQVNGIVPLKCLPSERGPPRAPTRADATVDHGEATGWQCHSAPMVAGNVFAFGRGNRLALTTHDPVVSQLEFPRPAKACLLVAAGNFGS